MPATLTALSRLTVCLIPSMRALGCWVVCLVPLSTRVLWSLGGVRLVWSSVWVMLSVKVVPSRTLAIPAGVSVVLELGKVPLRPYLPI